MLSDLSGFRHPGFFTQLVPLFTAVVCRLLVFQTARGNVSRGTTPEVLDEVPPPENVSC